MNIKIITDVFMRRLLVIAVTTALAVSAACTKKSDSSGSSATLTVAGAGQTTDPGKAYAEDIVFTVRSAGGAPLPNVSIVLETLTDGASSSHLPGYEVVQTNNEGRAPAKAVGGNVGGFESKFKAYLAKDTKVSVEFALFTNGTPGGGGASNGDVSGDTDSKGGGGKTSGVEDGKDTGSTQGGGVDNKQDQGGQNQNTDTSPGEADIANYLVEVITTNNAPIVAGVPFGLRITAKAANGDTVKKRDGMRALTIDLATKTSADATTSSVIPKANYATVFGAFGPDVPTATAFNFKEGVVTLPVGDAVTIRKYLQNMVVFVMDDTSKKGESVILDIKVGPLDKVEVALAEDTESADTNRTVVAAGTELKGRFWELQSGLPIGVHPPPAPLLAADYPLAPFSTSVALTVKVNGYDQFTNMYVDPILCKWSALDIGNSVATYPSTPVFSKYLALKANRVAMNLFAPNESGNAALKVENCQTSANGLVGVKGDTTGVLSFFANKPTNLLVDMYAPTGDGNPPNTAVVNPLPAITAGKPAWLRIAATNSFGTVDTNWSGTYDITFTVTNASDNAGWPLPEDATLGNPTANVMAATFMSVPVIDNPSTTPSAHTFVVPVEFIAGYGWVRQNTGPWQTAPMATRPMAAFQTQKAGEQPRINAQDLVNNMAGTTILQQVLPDALFDMRIVFNDSYTVPAGYGAVYPTGINLGTSVKDYKMQVGDGRSIAAWGYDQWGNKIGQEAANWAGVGMPNHFIAVAFNTKVNFLSPKDVLPAGGKIRITSVADSNVSVDSGTVIVDPGIPAKFVVTPKTAPKAGTKFGIEIKAVDSSGATSVAYDTQAPLPDSSDHEIGVKVTLTGVTNVPQASWFAGGAADLTAYNNLINQYKAGKDFSLEFTNGVAEIPDTDAAAFLLFFSSENPAITVTTLDTTISGTSAPLTIAPEALESLRAKVLKTFVYTHPVTSATTTYPAGSYVNTITISAGQSVNVETEGFDKYQNSLGSIPVDWSNTDNDALPAPAIPGPSYNGSQDNFVFYQDSNYTVYAPRRAGDAYIKMTTAAGVCGGTHVCNPLAGPIVGETGIMTSEIGKAVAMRVSNNDALNTPRPAGYTHTAKLELLDANNQVATSFTGNVDLVQIDILHNPGEEFSVFGAANVKPAPQTVNFSAGTATLSGFQFVNMYDSPKIRIIAKDPASTNNLVNGGDSAPFITIAGSPYTLRIVNQPQTEAPATNRGPYHRPAIFHTVLNPLAVYAGSAVNIYTGAFDQYGNWVQDVNSRWDLPANCEDSSGATVASQFNGSNVTPSGAGSNDERTVIGATVPTGWGCVVATKMDPIALTETTYTLNRINVLTGSPAQLRLVLTDHTGKKMTQNFPAASAAPTIDPGFQIVADEPLMLEISVHDMGGSISGGLNKPAQQYNIEFFGAQDSNGADCTVAGATKTVRNQNPPTVGPVTTITGLTHSPTLATTGGLVSAASLGHFFVPKAGGSFEIRVNATIDGSPMLAGVLKNLTAVPNTIVAVNARSGANGSGTLLQGTTQTITADTPVMVYSAGYDRACNFIADQPSAWTADNQLASRLVGDTATGQNITINPKLVGVGEVIAVGAAVPGPDPSPCTKCAKVNYTINPGAPASIRLTSQHNTAGVNVERAGVPFTFSATFVDQHGNTATSVTGAQNLNFSWNASNATSGYQALLPSTPTYTFNNGVLSAASFAAPSFPADFTNAPTHRLRVAKPGETVTLNATWNGVAPAITGSMQIVVNPGPVKDVYLYDVTSAPVAAPIPPLLLQKPVDVRPMFAAKGFDPAGNSLGDMFVDWETSTNVSDSFYPKTTHLDRLSGSVVVVTPSILSDAVNKGTVKATYARVDAEINTLPTDYLTATVKVDVVAGSPVQFSIAAPALAIANDPFGFTIAAKDIKGNVVSSMVNGQTFHFSFDNATNSPTSASFTGNVPPSPPAAAAEMAWVISNFNAPTAGTATIAPVANPGPNFKLTNANDRVKLKVRWQDPGLVNRFGESAFIDVDPNVTNFYRITKEANGTLNLMSADSVNVGNPMLYYANAFDAVGNFRGNEAMLWKGTDILESLLKAAGNTDLIAGVINKAATKVRLNTTGQPSEPVTNTAVVTIAVPANPAVPVATLNVTLNPAQEAKIAAYVTDGSGNIAVSAGQYTLPQAVIAGTDYQYRLEVQDIYGNRAAYNNTIDVSVDLPTGTTSESLLGFLPTIDQPGTITFVDGLWQSGAPKKVRFSKFGTWQMTALDGSASPLAANAVSLAVAKDTVAGHVRISDGNLEASAIVQPSNVDIDLTAGIARTFHAAQFDAGGNWIGVANASWSGTNALASPVIPVGALGTSYTINPTIVGTGSSVGISWDHDSNVGTAPLSYTLTNVDVLPSANVKDFLVSAPTTTTADNCFAVTVTIRDQFDNTVAAYDGLKTLNFVYDANVFTPDFTGDVDSNGYPSPASAYQFVNGVSAANAVQFCLRDTTAATTITIKDPTTISATTSQPVQGSFTIEVTHGNPAQIQFATAVRDGVGEPEAAPTCDITTDADQVNQAIYATVHDAHGNFIPVSYGGYPNTAGWSWTLGGVLTGKGTVVNSGRINLNPTLASMTTATTEVNVGSLTISGAGPLTSCGSVGGIAAVHVNPGAPQHFDVVAGVANSVRTTDLFALTITSKDQHDNVAWGIDALPATLGFTWLNGPPLASPSLLIQNPPTVTAASLVGPSVIANFTNGVYVTAAATQIPNAGQDTLQIRVSSGAMNGDTPAINVIPGPAAKVYIVKNAATGQVFNDQEQTNYMNTFNLYTGKFDALGNFIVGNEPVNWTLQGRSIVDNSVNGALVEFDAPNLPGISQIGVRTQTVMGQRVSGAKADVTLAHALGNYTVQLHFMPDPATQLVATKFVDAADTEIFNLLSGSTPQVVAGQQFYVVLEARDAAGNVEVTFPANFAMLLNAVAPSMQDISITAQPTFTPTVQTSGSYTFNYNGTGRAKIGPYRFYKAGQSHSLDFADNDASRVLTSASIPAIVVNSANPDHLTLLTGTTTPPPLGEILLNPATLTAANPSYPFFTGIFDAYGNYKGNANANYSWVWDPNCSCSIGLSGNGTPTGVVTPIQAGSGRLTAVGSGGATNGLTVTSPLLTVEAGAGSKFQVDALFNDQDGVTSGEQALTLTDLLAGFVPATGPSWRINNSNAPSTDYQRVGVPFSLRIRAVDNSGLNTSPTFCQGNDDYVNTPRVCDVNVTYSVVPSAGPDATTHLPVTATTLKVRWNNGYGTFVENDGVTLQRPFIMRRAGEIIRITIADAGDPTIMGTSENITIKTGPLNRIKMRKLANDAGGIGDEYIGTVNPFQETDSLTLNAAGYDAHGNYIQDFAGTWTPTNQTGSIVVLPASGTVSNVAVTAQSQGTAKIGVSIAAVAGEHPLTTEEVNFVITPAPAKSFKLTLVATDCNLSNPPNIVTPLEVKAGDAFKVCVQAMTGLSGTGNVATSYSGSKPLVLTAANSTASDLGFPWTPATPDAAPSSYSFASGQSVFNDIKFTGIPSGTGGNIQFIVNDTANNISGSITIKNTLNVPGHLRIRRGPTHAAAEVVEYLQFPAAQRELIYGHIYDIGGNWLRAATPADAPVWLYESATSSSAMAPRAGLEDPANLGVVLSTFSNLSPINLNPQDATIPDGARVKLDVVADTIPLSKTVSNLTVTGSTATAFEVIPEGGDYTWSATDCFRLTVKAKDGVGNLAPLYVGAKNLQWTLTLAQNGNPYPTYIGGSQANELPIKAVVKLPDDTYTFGGGIYEAPFASFCLRDATDIADNVVRIRVTDTGNAITGYADITVSKGAASKYGIAGNIAESKVVCDVQTVVAGTQRSYYLHELDAVGNFIGHIQIPIAKWSPIGDFLYAGTVTATGDGNQGVYLNMIKTGFGSLKFDFPGPTPAPVGTPQTLYCNPSWNIINSPANELVITNEHGLQGEFATQEFTTVVTVYDQHGNIHTEYNDTRNLKFTAKRKSNLTEDAKDGLLGDRPKLAGVANTVDTTISATFVNGIWSDTSKKFNFPLADDDVQLKVEAPATTLLAGTRDITIKAGPTPQRLQVRTRSDRTGVIVDSAWTAAPVNAITTVGSKSFFTVLADNFGNYMQPTSAVTWSLPASGTTTPAAPLAPALTPDGADAGAAVFNPNAVSDGVIRASYTPANLTVNTFDTGEIVVTQAPAVKWRITAFKPTGTDAPLDEESGVPYTFAGSSMRLKLEALDAEDTVVSGFTQVGATVNIKFEGATPAAQPFTLNPQLVGFGDITDSNLHAVTTNFTDGVGYVQVILYNKDDRVRFTVDGLTLTPAVTPEVKVKSTALTSLQVRYPVGFGHQVKTIKADQVLPVEVVGIDNYGNKIDNMQASLATVFTGFVAGDDYDGYPGFDSYDHFVASLDPATVDGTNKISIFQPVGVGRGKIQVTCTESPRCDSIPVLTTAAITVDPGTPKKFVVEVKGATQKFMHNDGSTPFSPPWYEANYIVEADQEFDIRVMAVDIFGNWVKTFAGGNALSFTFDVDGDNDQDAADNAELTSPKGNLPTVVTGGGTTSWAFTNGVWRSIDKADPLQKFLLKRANLTATEKPYLVVTDATAGLSGRTAERIDVVPSALSYVAFTDEASNAGAQHGNLGTNLGQEICPAGTCPDAATRIVMQTGDTRRLYISGYDSQGNYREDQKVDWNLVSTATPLPGKTNAESLSACSASGTGAACATGKAFAKTFFSQFTPATIGNYDVIVTAIDNTTLAPIVPTIASQLRVELSSGSATKFKGYVVYDENDDKVEDSVVAGTGSIADPFRVEAGKCFRIRIHALDANNNATNYGGTLNLDFFSDAPLGPTGFQPLPYGAPILNTLTFVNGIAWTDIEANGLHSCAQATKKGSFQFMAKSVPASQSWFVRISDGAGVGLEDDEVRIAIDPGATDFVALMAGNPATPEAGVMVGSSRNSSVAPDAIDITQSGNWTTAITCTSIDELLSRCATMLQNGVTHAYYERIAGQAPAASINYHRFYLAAFDLGGNFKEAPKGDWTVSKTTMGELPAAHAQWTTPRVANISYSHQYTKAEGASPAAISTEYSTRAANDPDVSDSNAIFYYPIKPKGGRITVKNVLSGGKYFYVNTLADMSTRAKDLSFAHLTIDRPDGKYIAGQQIAWKVALFDDYNNPAYNPGMSANIAPRICAGTDTTCATNIGAPLAARTRHPLGGYVTMSANATEIYKQFNGSESSIVDVGTYKLRVDVNGSVSDVLDYDVKVYPAAPVTYALIHDTVPAFNNGSDPCSTSATVETPTVYRSVVVDNYGNETPYKHGWARLYSGSCVNPVQNWGFGLGDSMEDIEFLDSAGNLANPPGSGNGTWCYSEKARVWPRRAFSVTTKNTEQYGGKYPTSFSYATAYPDHPNAATNYDMTSAGNPLLASPTGASIIACNHSHQVAAGPVRDFSVFIDTGPDSFVYGTMFAVRVEPRDKFDNQATSANGGSANFTINWDPLTVLDAPDMCAVRGLDAPTCTAEKNKVVGSGNREWQAPAQLANGTHTFTFAADPGNPQLSSNGKTAEIYRIVNKTVPAKLQVCYVPGSYSTGQSQFDNLNPADLCDIWLPIQPGDRPSLEMFATSAAGSGYFYDTALTLNGGNTTQDKTFLASETAQLYVGQYDRFGNYNGPVLNPTFALIDNGTNQYIWGADGVTLLTGQTNEFTDQWTNWANGNPLQLGTTSRMPRSARMNVTATSFGTLDLGRFNLVEAPPGPAIVRIYPGAHPAAEFSANPTINAGTEFYFTVEVRDIQGQRLSSFSGDKTVTFSHSITATRDGIIGAIPATGTRRFCNGIMVSASFDLGTNCPGNGDAPAAVDYYREPITISSKYFNNPAMTIAVDVNGASSIGSLPSVTLQPLAATYLFATPATQNHTKSLNATMAFNEGPASINVRAADQYGNETTAGLGSANAVAIGIYNTAGLAQGNVCSTDPIGSCAASLNVFKCGGTVGNCLNQTIDMTSGSATISNLEFDSSGFYYIAFGQSQALKTFTNNAEMNSRAARLTIGCGVDCLHHFDLEYTTPQNIGNAFNVTVKAKDLNGRLIQDAGLSATLSSEVLDWGDTLLTRINGGAPDNRAAVGFGSGNGEITLAFAGGQASIPNMTINQANEGGSALTPAIFQFAMKNYPAKTSSAPGNLEILSSAVTEYRITATGATTKDAAPTDTFNVTVASIDRGGNYVNNPSDVTIVPVKVSGPATTTGAFEGASNTCTLATGQCTFNNLYYRVPNVTDIKVLGYTSTPGTYPRITFNFVPGTIKGYEMDMVSNPHAYDASLTPPGGTLKTTATLRAFDGANNYIANYTGGQATAMDATINGYAWVSQNNEAGWPNTKFCPTPATWVNATTTCDVQIKKAGNIAASNLVHTVGGVAVTKTFSGTVVVQPNIINSIRICGTQNGCASSLAAATDTADDSASVFYINGYDFFDNLRNNGFGETSGTAWAVQTLNPVTLVSPTDYEFTNSAGTTGGVSFKGYTVPQSPTAVTLRATGPAPTTPQDIVVTVSNPTGLTKLDIITFTPDPPTNIATGNQISVSDVRGYYTANGQYRLKTDLDGVQSLAVSHDMTTAAAAPIPASVNCTFTDGVCTTVNNFTLSRPATGRSLTLTYGGQSDAITGISIVPSVPKRLEVIPAATTVTAGTAFNATVRAYDLYDNHATNYGGTINIDFAWNNVSNTVSANGTYHNQAPDKPAATNYTFSGGDALGVNFRLKRRAVDTGKNTGFATLGIASEDSADVTSSTASGVFTINADSTVDYVKIMQASTADLLSTSEIGTHTMTTADTKQLWAAGYDQYGNWIGLQSGNWSAPGVLNGRLGSVTGVNTVTANPNVSGTDTISVDVGGKTDATGLFTINPAAATYFTYASFPTTTTAGAHIAGWTIEARDPEGNIDTGYTGNKTITWSWQSAPNSPAPATRAADVGSSTVNFGPGTASFSGSTGFILYGAGTGLSTKLRASASGITASDTASITTVSAGALYRYRLSGVTTTQTAGTAFGGTVSAFDQWDNPKNVASNPNLTFSWTGTSATNSRNGTGHNLAALPSSAQTINFAGTNSASTGNIFTLYKGSVFDTNARVNITASSDGVTNFTESTVGPFTINAAATADYIVVHNTNTANTPWTPEFTTHTMTADQTLALYAHSYDMYGNPKGLINASWSGSGVASSNVSPTAASNTTTFTAVTTGTGTVTATAASTTPTDATGTITVDPGALQSFTVTGPGSATAGQDIVFTVVAKDADNNTKTDYTGSQAITWTWNSATNAPSGTQPKKPAGNVTFASGSFTSTTEFALYNASNTNVTLTATQSGKTGTSGNIATVAVGAPNALSVNSISATTVSAGDAITATLHLKDTWGNMTSGTPNCAVAVSGWGTSPGHGGAPAKAPDYPGSISPSGAGVFNVTGSSLKLYNAAGPANLTFTASGGECGGGLAVNQSMTVNAAATPDHIWLSDTNSIPGAHLTNKDFGSSASPSGTLYAFAWDAYGNNISGTSYACPDWQYTNFNSKNNEGVDYTLPNSVHAGALSSIWHIDGDMKCVAGGTQSANTTVFQQISKDASYSCGLWSCSAGNVQRLCTINNTTGYDIASVSYGFSGSGSNSGCTGPLATGNNCNATVTGTVGQAIGTATATITASVTTDVTFPDRTFTDATVAPNCTNTLATTQQAGWSCDATAKKGKFTVRTTNNNTNMSTTFSATTFSGSANNHVVETDNCDVASAISNGGSCDTVVRYDGTGGETATLQFNADDAYFVDPTYGMSAAPNCTDTVVLFSASLGANDCGAGDTTRTVTYTLKNNNTLNTATFNSITDLSTIGVVSNNTCNSTLAPGATCTFDVTYTDASLTGADTTNLSISMGGTYFSNTSVGVNAVSNKCP